jgi:hypothetical protein
LRTRARATRRRGRTVTEKEGAVVGAEAGERASVGMASSWARAESAGARGKRQVGREETETQGREKWARTTIRGKNAA